MTENPFLEIWEAYSASWGESDESTRKEILDKNLISDCQYTDPDVDITGFENLSDYMQEFQKSFPGAKFITTDFEVHHNQSLAHWNMTDLDANILSRGASFAIYKNGKLSKMTGFFMNS